MIPGGQDDYFNAILLKSGFVQFESSDIIQFFSSLMQRNLLSVKVYSISLIKLTLLEGVRCSSVVRAFAHGAMGRRIDPPWCVPIELYLVPASAS